MSIIVARRYAQALHEEAEQQGQTEKIDADMELIRASLEGAPELMRLFESPIISREKKEKIFQELFAPRVQPLTMRFLSLLVEKQRENIFPAIVRAYQELRDEQRGIVEAQARTARPLDAAEQEKLSAALEKLTGSRIRLAVQEDPTLLGGLVVRVGDTVYDGSVRHQLESMREQMGLGTPQTN